MNPELNKDQALAAREPFFGQKMIEPYSGALLSVEVILRQFEPLQDAARTRSLRQGRRSPLKNLLTHEEYKKYRRLRRRLSYWENLGFVEWV
jgi:hypothetical protein